MAKRRINPTDIQFEIDHQQNRTLVRASITVSALAEISKEVDFSKVEDVTRRNLSRAVMDMIYGDMWILAKEIGINIFELAPESDYGPYGPILDLLDKINKIGIRSEEDA